MLVIRAATQGHGCRNRGRQNVDPSSVVIAVPSQRGPELIGLLTECDELPARVTRRKVVDANGVNTFMSAVSNKAKAGTAGSEPAAIALWRFSYYRCMAAVIR
jgi:hypothetical protein